MDKDNQFDEKKEDPFVYMHRAIKVGVSEATDHNSKADAEKMFELKVKLEVMENTLYLVKGMLKCRRPDKFEKEKAKVIERLETE